MTSRQPNTFRDEALASRLQGAAGFSLVELIAVLALGITLAGMSLMVADRAFADAEANSAMRAVSATLIEARDTALAERRQIEVRFVNTDQIQLIRIEPSGVQTLVGETLLEGNNEFRVFPGVPDTPDGWGNGAGVAFGAVAPPYLFTPDGSFVDNGGVPLSGTVFLGRVNQPETARAVTVFGGTGRIVAWEWDGQAWHR